MCDCEAYRISSSAETSRRQILYAGVRCLVQLYQADRCPSFRNVHRVGRILLYTTFYNLIMPTTPSHNECKSRTRHSSASNHTAHRQPKLSCHAKEEAIHAACQWLRTPEGRKAGGKPNYTAAAQKFSVPYKTLWDRWNGVHQAAHEAHKAQMLITLEQEQAMVEWMQKDAKEGHPWTRARVKLRVHELSGRDKLPSNSWVYAFNQRHNDILHFRSTSGLDPIRARCFNPTNMKDHFAKYGAIQGNYRLKVNIDETGNQLGGGQRNTGRKCYTVRGDDRSKYRARDASLELVTVIEACTSSGEMLDPGIIFNSTGGWTTE